MSDDDAFHSIGQTLERAEAHALMAERSLKLENDIPVAIIQIKWAIKSIELLRPLTGSLLKSKRISRQLAHRLHEHVEEYAAEQDKNRGYGTSESVTTIAQRLCTMATAIVHLVEVWRRSIYRNRWYLRRFPV